MTAIEREWELDIKQVKAYGKRIFKSFDPLPQGFGLDCITVVFRKNVMLIWDFTPEGKCNEGSFLKPQSESELLKKLVYHCGYDKIRNQVKNNIEIVF